MANIYLKNLLDVCVESKYPNIQVLIEDHTIRNIPTMLELYAIGHLQKWIKFLQEAISNGFTDFVTLRNAVEAGTCDEWQTVQTFNE